VLQKILLSISLLLLSTGCIFVQDYGTNTKVTRSAPKTEISLNANGTASASRLTVVWSTGDREVAVQSCLMYVENANKQKWFSEIALIVWGPSAKLLASDKELQARVELLIDRGTKVQACIACTDSYGVSESLKELGIDVKPMGMPLTEMLKADNTKVIVF
jgi:hypothetical protein